ncbi:MAG TPA: hypothetical protein VI299_10130 [Polyangiales bacterium]
MKDRPSYWKTMRITLLLLAIALTSCSEPQCAPGEVKVGITCRSEHLSDAAAGAPDDVSAADGSPAVERRDASAPAQPRDASTSTSDDHGGATSEREMVLDSLPGGPPRFQFSASAVTLNGGNVATLPNLRGVDALRVAAGTLARPTKDPLFGGAPSITFDGSQWLDSSLPASAWQFLTDGTGFEIFHVYAPTAADATNNIVLHAGDAASGPSTALGYLGSATASQLFVWNGSAYVVSPSAARTTQVNIGTAQYVDAYHKEDDALEFGFFQGEGITAAGATTIAPASSSPGATLRLGATNTNAQPARMRWCETLIFARVLHEYERQRVREYIEAQYGIKAPKLTESDLNIMSLRPFAFLDADSYVASADKVSAYLDRARPGHQFAQRNASLQTSEPIASTNFNGQRVVSTTGAQSYQSSLPAAAWTFLANLSTVYLPYRTASLTNTQVLLESQSNNANGLSWSVTATSGHVAAQLWRTPTAQQAVAVLSSIPETTYLARLSVQPTSITETLTGRPPATDVLTGTASSPAAKPLEVFGRAGTLGFHGESPGMIIFDRALTPADEAKLLAALQQKYGVTP